MDRLTQERGSGCTIMTFEMTQTLTRGYLVSIL